MQLLKSKSNIKNAVIFRFGVLDLTDVKASQTG